MSQHFYDGQIRKYITQLIRMVSNFSVSDGSGKLTKIPVTYGDISRQAASIIRENSENKLPNAPRMSLYVTGLEIDRNRTGDKTYSNKISVRERAYDNQGKEYLNFQGKNYTVERLMPAPYTLSVNLDIWSTNTDQKLQILEQLLILFNPSIELQSTDNYIDWTSLTVVDLENITWSSRSIPVGTESEIDVATLGFKTPIYISAPVKVKRLGVITNIITSVFDETNGTIDLGVSNPILNAYEDGPEVSATDVGTGISETTDVGRVTRGAATSLLGEHQLQLTTSQNYGIFVQGNTIEIIKNGTTGQTNWRDVLDTYTGIYQPDISRIYIKKLDMDNPITGTFSLNELDETKIVVNWDTDSFPNDTVISGKTTIDYIIDPQRISPEDLKTTGLRILILGQVGSIDAQVGAVAWKNNNGSNFIAGENDIIEWNGSEWVIVFDASEATEITYVTNLNTNIQYKWTGSEWVHSIEGAYPAQTWRVNLDG